MGKKIEEPPIVKFSGEPEETIIDQASRASAHGFTGERDNFLMGWLGGADEKAVKFCQDAEIAGVAPALFLSRILEAGARALARQALNELKQRDRLPDSGELAEIRQQYQKLFGEMTGGQILDALADGVKDFMRKRFPTIENVTGLSSFPI